jgi:hypothetical protein
VRASAALRVAALAGAVGTGCGEGGPGVEWDTAVVRAVVRRVDASSDGRRLVVVDTGRAGGELPWGVRQALATAGYEVSDGSGVRDAGVRALTLESSFRDGGDWLVDVLIDTAQASTDGRTGVRWRVRCVDQPCEVVDSTAIPMAEAERREGR